MNHSHRHHARHLGRWLSALALAVVLAVGLLPAAAHALTQSQITLDQEQGGQPTRFTFEALSDANAKVSVLNLTFPPGFDLTQSTVEAVTQNSALLRIPVKYTVARVGQTYSITFDPPLTPGIDVQVKVNNVLTPTRGGTFPFGVTYVADGVTQTQSGMSFSYATPSGGQQVAYWLNRQPWVAKWNSVPFLNLFLQPQYAAIAFTTVWVGWLISLALVALAFPAAIVGGLALAFMKMSKIAPIRWIASVYINVIRGTPLFLQIAIAFVGLPIAGFRFPWFPTGVVVLALNSSAYLAEIFRAGIQSINKGQFEAASSLGMTYPQAMQYVIIPQTVKRVLPTMTSEFILLFKDTALLSAVGVFELMLYSNNIVARSGNITPFMVAAIFYLIVTIPLINWVGRLERRLAISEGGQIPETKKARSRRLAADVVVDAAMPGSSDADAR